MLNKIRELGAKVKDRQITWEQATEEINKLYNLDLSTNAMKKRFYKLEKKKPYQEPYNEQRGEYQTVYGDGTIEAQKIVNLSQEQKDNPNEILKAIGYNPEEWELQMLTFSSWQQHTKEQVTKELYAVKFKVKPKVKEAPSVENIVRATKEVLSKEIKPIKLAKKTKTSKNNEDLMIVCPAVELHLGKLAWYGETGENYDYKIAIERYEEIIQQISEYQNITQANNLYFGIGNDFFNTDTTTYTTTKGTPQSNDVRWQKMFMLGLEINIQALLKLREQFDNIDMHLTVGNHDTTSSFYLYIALQQYFKDDDVIHFKDDWKPIQVKVFGENAIFTHHGDKNFKRLIKSIPHEFYQEWGATKYRNLFLGHLHTEKVVDEDSGLVVRRVGSPSGIDEWHYSERFIGARQQHQIFLFDKEKGLINSHYIVFEPKKKLENEKVLRKRYE